MKKTKAKIDRVYLEKEIKRLDPNLEKTDEYYLPALVLLASTQTGADVKKIARLLDEPESKLRKYEKNLRKYGIWVGKKVAAGEWLKKNTGGISFWLDALVALGYMKRVKE